MYICGLCSLQIFKRLYFNGPSLQDLVWSAALDASKSSGIPFFHLRSDNYEELRLGWCDLCRAGPRVAQGDNYKIGKCNGFNGTDQNKAGRERWRGPARSPCKLNFKMTMWRDDLTFYRQ